MRQVVVHLRGVFYNNMNSSTATCIKAPVPYPFLGSKEIRKFARQYTKGQEIYKKQQMPQETNRSIAMLYNLRIITACICFCRIFNII